MDCNSVEGGVEGILEVLVAGGIPLQETSQDSTQPYPYRQWLMFMYVKRPPTRS